MYVQSCFHLLIATICRWNVYVNSRRGWRELLRQLKIPFIFVSFIIWIKATHVCSHCARPRLSMECELRNFTTRYELIKYLARILQWQGEDGDGDSIKFGYKSIVVFPKHTKYFQSNEVKKMQQFKFFYFVFIHFSWYFISHMMPSISLLAYIVIFRNFMDYWHFVIFWYPCHGYDPRHHNKSSVWYAF